MFRILAIIFCLVPTAAMSLEVQTLEIKDIVVEDGIAMSPSGDLYISDYYGHAIRKIAVDGEITTLNIELKNPNGLTVDEQGTLFIVNQAKNQILSYQEDGTSSVFASGIPMPAGIAINRNKQLFVTSYGANRIFQISNDGNKTLFLKSAEFDGPVGIAFDDDNRMYIANYNNGWLYRISEQKVPKKIARVPGGVGFITYGNSTLFLSGIAGHKVYRLGEDDELIELVGTGQKASIDGDVKTAAFDGPNGLVISNDGTKLYVTDFHSKRLREITLD